jgi:V8-like Glu-specific endopeptidase
MQTQFQRWLLVIIITSLGIYDGSTLVKATGDLLYDPYSEQTSSLPVKKRAQSRSVIKQASSATVAPAFNPEMQSKAKSKGIISSPEYGDVPTSKPVPKAIIGVEDRYEVDVRGFPFSAVGRITYDIPVGFGTCTGSLVGPRVVLTNGHCVWDNKKEQFHQNIKFAPAHRGDRAPYGEHRVSRVVVSQKYLDGEHGYDYAFLVLTQPVGRQAGWLGVTGYNPRWNNGRYWYVAGYGTNYEGHPFDSRYQTANQYPCQIHTQLFGRAAHGHDCDTGQGNSGSPLFGYWHRVPYVIGVNYAGWGPRNEERMENCPEPEVGRCMNIAARSEVFLPTLQWLLKNYP